MTVSLLPPLHLNFDSRSRIAAVTDACSSCDPGEAACTGNGVGLATACATDAEGKQLFLYNGDCVSSESCPAALYADAGELIGS